MLLNIKLLGDKSVVFEVEHVNQSIHKWMSPILFVGADNYIIEKSNELKYTTSRLTIPFTVSPKKVYLFQYDFLSDEERHMRLKKLYKNLISFSRSNVFKDQEVNLLSFKINLSEDRWFIY
jgi:hypothetical protein